MLLYDIFYCDGTMDRSTRLPARSEPGARAENTNGDGHVYFAQNGQWIEARRLYRLAD